MRTIRRRRREAAAVAGALLLAGCTQASRATDRRTSVVTTVSPITNIVQNVAGDRAVVTGIVPEGVNSHTFEPAPSDARTLAEADIVFINGLHLEEPTRELAEANVADGVEIIELGAETVGPDDYIFDLSFPRSEENPNPHLWTNPPYAKRFAEVVAVEMGRLDPKNARHYTANYAAFARRIDELDGAVRRATRTVPRTNRKLLTYHDSFPYFARDYGWEIVGAIQPSDFSEPTPREVARLIDQVRAEDVPAIFGSEVFPSPVLEQIAAETGTRYIDDLRDDDLPGEPGDPEHSYLSLMVFDFVTIISALGGDVSALESVDTSNLIEGRLVEYRS